MGDSEIPAVDTAITVVRAVIDVFGVTRYDVIHGFASYPRRVSWFSWYIGTPAAHTSCGTLELCDRGVVWTDGQHRLSAPAAQALLAAFALTYL